MSSRILTATAKVLAFLGVIAAVVIVIYQHSVWVGTIKKDRAAKTAGEKTEKEMTAFDKAVAKRQVAVMSNTAEKAMTFATLTDEDLLPVRTYYLDRVDMALGYLAPPSTNAAGTHAASEASAADRRRIPSQEKRVFRVQTIAANLDAPDGLAVNPVTEDIFVSEKEPGRIRLLRQGMLTHVVDSGTMIYTSGARRTPSGLPLRQPEGMAFSRNGDLYVVEDLPGGRVIRFPMEADGKYTYGVAEEIPGLWPNFAWESIAVGPRGDLLISGSDMKRDAQGRSERLFSGAMVYRDADGNWWVPYDRLFARFSSVIFSKSGRHAVYACELTGELGWIDLQTRRPVGGMSRHIPEAPEGICALPDGTYLVAERGGAIIRINPATDESERIIQGLNSINSIIWDPGEKRVLVSDNEAGRIMAVVTDTPFREDRDLFDYAIFHPNYSPQHVPDECPDYLRSVLEVGGLGGADFQKAYVSFRDFAARVPLIAAKADAVLVSAPGEVDDPIEEVQFVIFEPSKMLLKDDAEDPTTLAAFAVRKKSGKIVKTSLVRLVSHDPTQYGRLDEEERRKRGFFVPRTRSVAVSMLGIAAIQFTGMGIIPDYSVVLNPWNEKESYLVVFNEDGTQHHYRLKSPGESSQQRELWVLAYSHTAVDEWPKLADAEPRRPPEDVELSRDVYSGHPPKGGRSE